MTKRTQPRKTLYLAIAVASQMMASHALAGPEGGRVVGGHGSIEQSGLNTTIQQQTDRMAIDWQSFDVAADERVQFIQPSSSSLALNRVLSHTGSEIHGRIEANGHILLVNPNGVFFGENSHINVGGMIASGLSIDPADFMNGEFTLTALEGTEGKVIQSGIINAATGGSVSLIGQQVNNEGMISAKLGAVNLAAGKEAVVTFDQQGLVGVRITKEVLQDELGIDAALINSGEISAKGGRILLSASTSQDIFSQAVNHGELNSASSVVVHEDGSFTLGAGADVINTGSLDVSSAGSIAGEVVVIGENITHSGHILANTGAGNAGSIELHSVDTTRIMESASVVAEAATAGVGGEIKILGNKVGLFNEARINASGANGGGEVLVGGDESGTNTRIRNADFIYLGQDTQVSADGMLDGDGGKIITFASDTARIHGELSARGGEFGGNGGFIETSGLKGFELSSTPHISSPTANGGTWLIDPYNIDISSSDTSNIPETDNIFVSSETRSVVYFDTLQSVLNSAGNEGTVIIRTGAGGNGDGNISLLNNIEYNLVQGETTTLRLEAHNSIIFGNNRYIKSASDDSGKLNIELIANLDGDTSNGGNIIFNQGSYVSTSGGYFSAGVRFDTNEQGELVARPEDIATPKGNDFLAYANNNDDFATIDTSTGTDDIGGAVIINMGGAVSAGSSVVTGGADFTLLASSSFTNNFNNATINTSNNFGGGDITINSTGDVNLGAVDFSYLYTNDAVRSGSVTIEAGGNVYLHRNIDFNDTEIFNDTDPNNGQDSFLAITAAGDINILGSITDSWSTDERDIFDITLDAGGAVDIQGSIATSGGNFTILNSASVTTGDDGGASISTLGTYEDTTTYYGNVTINSTGAVSIGSAIDTAGGSFTVNSSSTFSNNFNDGDALISTGGGVFSVTSSGAVSIGSTVATSGGDFIVVESGSFNSNLNDAYIDASTSSSAPIGAGGGDIQINSDGDIILGLMDFTYAATTDNNNTVRVGSVTATAGGNISLARLLNYNDTGPRDVDAVGNLPNHGEDTFIDFTANGDININALIYDRIGDARDSIAINLTADADNSSAGTVNVNADIYTSGGSFTASGFIFDSSGFVINADHANSGEGPEPGTQALQREASWTDGGDIVISATSSITLGQLVTDSTCLDAVTCTGNLTLQNRVVGVDFPSVSQNGSLSITGSLTVDVGAGDVTLANLSNNFAGPLIFNNAGTVELVNANTAGTVIGQSTIGGAFTLTSGGDVTQSDDTVSLRVNGQTSLSATNNSITLANQSNDFVGVVNVSSVGSLTLSDSNNLSVGGINTSGNTSRATGNIMLTAGGDLTTGIIAANGATGNISNRNGGEVTLSANNNINVTSISTFGAGGTDSNDARTGGSGGSVSLISNNGSIEVGSINTSGGDGDQSSGPNNRNGGQAGNILITAQAPEQRIILSGNLTAQGGLRGDTDLNGAGGDINLNGSVQLANNVIINAGVKESASGNLILGNIVFDGALNSDSNAARDLNLVANNITFSQDVGNINRLGSLDIKADNDVEAQNIVANTLTAIATRFYTGDVSTSAAVIDTAGGGITIAAEDIRIGTMNSSGLGLADGGSISVTASGDNAAIALNGDINAQAGDNNNIPGNVEITLASAGSVFLNHTDFFTSVTNIIGSGGNDTLRGFDIDSTWTIVSGDAGRIGNGTIDSVSFDNIEHLIGGSNIDTFSFLSNSDITGSVDAGDGDDIFNIATSLTSALAGGEGSDIFNVLASGIDVEIDGGVGGNDTVKGFDDAVNTNEWTLNNANAGTLVNNGFSILFSGIETLEGGTGNDILQGRNEINDWQITGNNEGTLAQRVETPTDIISFSAIENVGGGNLNDYFTFGTSGFISGVLSGGTGEGTGIVNTIIGRDTENRWNITGTNAGAISDLPSGSGEVYLASFQNIQILNGSTGIDTFILNGGSVTEIYGGGSGDSLHADNLLNTWTLNTSTSGTLQTQGPDGYLLSFSDIENLGGSNQIDTFIFAMEEEYSGVVDAVGADNIVSIADDIDANIEILLGQSINGVLNVDIVMGNGLGSITVHGDTADTHIWEINDLGNIVAEADGRNDGRVSNTNGNSIRFINFANLIGSEATDNFIISDGASITGMINGGSGLSSNTLSSHTSSATWSITGSHQGNLIIGSIPIAAFNNIQKFIGSGSDTLIGHNQANDWQINAFDQGYVQARDSSVDRVDFSGMQRLQGSGAVDVFTINADYSGPIAGGGDADIFNINAMVNNLYGESGNDQFVFSGVNNAGVANVLDGGNDTDTVIGRDIDTLWTLSTSNTLTSGNDTYVNGIVAIEILQGGGAIDTFDIENDIFSSIRGGGHNDIFNINATVDRLFGEAGDDQFIFSSPTNNGRANSIDGGDGNNILIARHANNTWNFSASGNSLSVTGNVPYVTGFTGIQTLQGGESIDRFIIDIAFGGSILGGDGNDIFTVNAEVNLLAGEGGDDEFTFSSTDNAGKAANIDGGIGTNTLRGKNTESIWTLTGSYSGSLAENQAITSYVTHFTDIHMLEGGTAEDSLVGQDHANQWHIDGVNTGRIGSPDIDVTAHLAFSSMENIVGGIAQDSFIFTTTASDITGLIDGGTNGNELVQDILDVSLPDQAVVVELFDSNTTNLHAINVEQILAPVNTVENNYLTGASDRAYVWTIDSVNSGTVARADSPSGENTTRFINFGQLRGGENSDRFEVIANGSIAGTIHGGDGGGIDFADYSNTSSHVTVALGGDGSLGVTGINGIEGVVGNNGGLGDAQFNSVIGITNGDNVWTIGSFDSVTDGINDGQIAITLADGSIKIVSFENFNILSGGYGNDEFNLSRSNNKDGLLLGYINGGAGSNTFNAAISDNNPFASTADQVIQIRNTPLDLNNLDVFTPVQNMTQVFGFTNIAANADTNNALISVDSANTWNINANDINNVITDIGQVGFSGFTHLVGGSALDTFYVRSLDGPLQLIDGGQGTNDTVDFTQLDASTPVVVGLGETAVAEINILGIEAVNAHNHAGNELVSDAPVNIWRITDADIGSLNTSLTFSGFANLTGMTGDDSFIFANENARLSGAMDGGAGFDTLDLTSLNRDASVQLAAGTTGNGELRIINLEQVEASTRFVNTLLGGNLDNLWSISESNTGSLNTPNGGIEFIGFQNLVGGAGDDQFVFHESGVLDGFIDGSSQSEAGEDLLDLSRLARVDLLLADAGPGYRGLERVIGNDQDSSLRGQGANTWNLTGQNSGNINNTTLFEGFTALIGGEGNDQFNLTQGSLAGSVSGGMGNDRFSLGDAVIADGIYGDGGNDLLEALVVSGTTGTVNFFGGTDNNSLTITGGGAGFTAQHSFTSAQNGQLRYLDSANNGYTVSYSDVTGILDNATARSLTINTTASADNIVLGNRAYTFNELISVAYSNKNNLLVAASSNDQVIVGGAVTVPQLLTIQDAQVSSSAGGSIAAAGLRLDGTAVVGSESNRLDVNVNDLYIRSTSGAVYLNEQNTLNISEFSANGLIDLLLDGDLTSSIALSSAQGFNATSTNGSLVLDKENALSGILNLAAESDIHLRNLTSTNIADISARQLNINSNGVINGSGLIEVSGLSSFVSGGNINLANREHNFNSVLIGSAAGVSINNIDMLTLTGIDTSGAVNINAQGINANGVIAANNLILDGNQGAVTVSTNIQVSDEATLSGQSLSVAGDIIASGIQLNAQDNVLLNGVLSTINGRAISITANSLVQNSQITAGTDALLMTTEDFTQNANITAVNRIILDAGTDLLMNGSYTTQGGSIAMLAGGTLNMNRITAANGIRVDGGVITQQNSLSTANGDINIAGSSFIMSPGTLLTATTGAIQIDIDTNITAQNINAGTNVSLSALGNLQLNEDIVTGTGFIDIQGRNINLAGDLMGQTDINIRSATGTLQQQGLLQSQQGNIVIDIEGDLVMAGGSETRADRNIAYRAANLAVTEMEASAGVVTLTAHRGAVTDNNGQSINVTAQRLVVDAETGIGANDVFETLVGELSVSNNQGDIRLQNDREVIVDRLRSNGNIIFNNLSGNVTLDNTNGLLFSRNETDARLAGGTMNANYDIGTLTINVAQGDLAAINTPNLDNPDIVARNAALIAPAGNIGSPGRPLVIYVKDSLFIGGLRSWSPLWGFDTAPQFVENTSTIQGNLSDLLASGSEQLVAVETLEEVNPAIFTSVRNYFYDDISILLPRDQLYYDDDYEQ